MTARLPLADPAERLARDLDVLAGGGLFGARARRRARPAPYRPQTGDILLRLLANPESIGLASCSLSGYSHCGVVRACTDRIVVADCYPALHGHHGGARQTPWAAWTTREGPDDVAHWLALRLPDLDLGCADRSLDALAAAKPRFSLVLEREARLGEELGAAANCSAFVRAFLEAQGVDCAPALAATTLTVRVLARFFSLVRNGFYNTLPGSDFYTLAQTYGFTTLSTSASANLPPGFGELLPELVPVGYGQNPAVPAATRHLLLAAYARYVPWLRTALACHELTPETALCLLGRHRARPLRRQLRNQPPQVALCGTHLAIARLLALAETPEPYLTIPLAAHFGLRHPGPITEALVTALLRLTPPAAALARRLGCKPFHLFDAPL